MAHYLVVSTEKADDAGRAAIARAALGPAERAARAAGRLVPAGYGLDDADPALRDAPEEVRSANARLRSDREERERYNREQTARSEPFRPARPPEQSGADRSALDAWRAKREDAELSAAHREKLLRENLWAAWLSVAPSLSERAREIAAGLFRGGALRGADIADFQRLGEKEQEAVARLARLSRDPAAGTLLNTLGDAGIGFVNGVATLPANALKQIGALTTSIDQAVFGKDAGLIDNAELNRRARTEQRLMEALDDPAGIDPSGADHGYLARSLIGAAATLPYMGYASAGGAGVAAVALDMMQRLDDRIAADGGDVYGQGPEWAARKAVYGALYAGVEKVSALPIFKETGDIALKTAFLKLATRHGAAAAEKVAAHVGKQTFVETLEEAAQAVIEEHAASVGLGRGDGWAEAARAGVREFAETAGTMGLVALTGTARQGIRARSVKGRAELAEFAPAAIRREAFILSDNPYAGRGDAGSVGRSWAVAAGSLDGYRSDWAQGGQAALETRGDLTPEQAAVLAHVFEGEREGREAGEFIIGRNLAARADADASGAVYEELDAARVRQIVDEAGPEAEARLAAMGFTEAGAAKVAGYVRKEAALDARLARVLGDVREGLARDADADPARAGEQAAAAGRMLELQPLREVYQRAGTPAAAVKAFKELRFTQEQAEGLAKAFDDERAFSTSPEAAAAWRASYLDASAEATPGERLRRMTGFDPAPAPEAGAGASLLTLRGRDGKTLGEIVLHPDTAEAFDPEGRFSGEAVEQATGGAVTAAEWQALTPEERADAARRLGLRARGGFTVTDPADPSAAADGAQADILTGRVTLAPDAPSATLYHEAAHAWLAVMRRAGKLSSADVAKLREAYGPSAADPAWFNEEALADDIREIGAETDYAADKPLARRFIDAVRRFAGAARAEESRRAAASGARQALYESIVYGAPFDGVGEFGPSPQAAPDGKGADAADPIAGASTAKPDTGGVKSGPGNVKSEPHNPQKDETNPPKPETGNLKPEGSDWSAATPQGNLRVGGRWVIAPRGRFISDTDPRYDFTLQNRSRDAALGSSEQVAQIVAAFDPMRLLDSPDTANGAPVAVPVTLKGPSGKDETFYMVLSGNGRFRALDKLDETHRGDEYRGPVQAFADKRGIPYAEADMTEAARPRLVRLMTRRPAGTTYQRIAELSNQNAVLQMTDAERAYSDAALIERDGTADLYAANKDGLPSRNGSDAFFSWFTGAAGDASLLDSKGNPTDAARARGRRAMLALAIGRGKRGKETVMAFTENAEALGLERQREALLMSAGALSALGERKPDYALADDMSRAAADLLLLARERKAGKTVTVNEFLAQGDMLDAMPPAAGEALQILDSGRPAEGIAAAFWRYADLAAKIDTGTDDMFGVPPSPKDQLLRKAAADTDVKAPDGPRYSIALAARRYALATGMPAEGERLIARQLEFMFARHMDPAYLDSRARATATRRAKAEEAERRKVAAVRDAAAQAFDNPDSPWAWEAALAASGDGTVSRIAHRFFMQPDRQRFPHSYDGKPLYGTRVNTPRDAAALLMPLRNPYQESFKAIFLDEKNRVLGAEVCTLGLLDSAPVHPRETFKRGMELGAARVILAHNHPSGDPTPSNADRDITRRLDEAAKVIGLQYVDHIITNGQSFYSFASGGVERIEGHAKAEWEAIAAGGARQIHEPDAVAALARVLRQGAENVIHAVLLDTKNRITAVKRIPFDPARVAEPTYQQEAILREVFRAAAANPTAGIIIEAADRAVSPKVARALYGLAENQAKVLGIPVLDTLHRDADGWAYSARAGARVMPLETAAAAEPEGQRYSVAVNPDDYFTADPEARDIPLTALLTLKDEPEQSVANALLHIRAAKAGERAKRAPVSVADNGDGTFTVIDGNATSAALARMGHASVRARVEGADTGTRLGNSALILRPAEAANLGGRLRQRGLDGMDAAAAIDRLLDMARENTTALRELCAAAAASGAGKVNMRPGLKNKRRILEKTVEEYGGDAARVIDITGGEVWLPDTADFNDALKAIQKNLPAGAEIARVKIFNIGPGVEGGYGDVKVSILFANGGAGEIILASDYMLEAKHRRGGHHIYKITRALNKYRGWLIDSSDHNLLCF